MTEQEATKELERHIQFLRENWKPHPDCIVIETLGMAINALEKQIPKKPIIKSLWSVAKCPCCGADLGEYVNDGYPKNWESLKFCDCGQRLDWRNEEWES